MKYFLFLLVLCPLVGAGFYLWKGPEITDYFSETISPNQPTSKVAAHFFNLTSDKQKKIRSLYAHAIKAGRDKDFNSAFNDLSKIHKLVPFYKRSKILQSYAFSRLVEQAYRRKAKAQAARKLASDTPQKEALPQQAAPAAAQDLQPETVTP